MPTRPPVVTVFRSPTGFLCELEPTVEALPAFDPEFLQEHGWRHPVPVHALWNLHALDPLEAAAAVIERCVRVAVVTLGFLPHR